MTYLADLHRTVEATLASQRLGRPVFVRYHWFGPESPDEMPARLTQLTALVGAWLDQDLDRLQANAAADLTHVALTVQFQAGATALIAVTQVPASDARVDLMILSNRGALYHEENGIGLGVETDALAWRPADALLRDRITRALRSGQLI
jgi:hypothetical protein